MWANVGDNPMLRGLTAVAIDDKGRMSIPARYRAFIQNDAGGLLVTTIDTESCCLLLYPFHYWEVIEQQLANLPSYHPATRRIQRLLIGHATECDMDRHGRILIPALLRNYAQLDKSIMLIGQGKKFEIWGEQQWQDARKNWLADNINDKTLPPELAELSL